MLFLCKIFLTYGARIKKKQYNLSDTWWLFRKLLKTKELRAAANIVLTYQWLHTLLLNKFITSRHVVDKYGHLTWIIMRDS